MKKVRVKGKKKRKMERVIVSLFLVVFLGASSCCVIRQAKQYQILKEEELKLEQEIKLAKKETLSFESNKKYYNSDDYIEQVAREGLGLVKPTEILYLERVENK